MSIGKTAKKSHLKIRSRDAASAQAFQAAALSGDLGIELARVVTRDEVSRLSRGTTFKPKTRKPTSSATWKPRVRRVKPYPKWSETILPTVREHRTATAWRDATDILKADYAHWALAMMGEFRSFTLNLGGDVEKSALSKGKGAAAWISQRLNYYLQKALGRPANYFFRLEMSEGTTPYLHLHGELGCTGAERAAVRKALRKAGGEWKGIKSSQVKLSATTPDSLWTNYAMKPDAKKLAAAALKVMGATPPLPSWRDRNFFISLGLKQLAEEICEDARKKLSVKTVPIRKAAFSPT